MRTKVCGLTRTEDVVAAAAAGADALGVVVDVAVETPREVTVEAARDLVAAAPPFVATVLVTMAEDPARIRDLLAETGADAVQVHADLPPATLSDLGADATVLKAVGASETEAATRYDGAVDALLVDSADAEGGGGTGRTHDWERTRTFARSVSTPVVLAGGLTPENVAAAVRTVDPYAVDVATGVERTGGVKDHDAVRAFVANATAGVEAA